MEEKEELQAYLRFPQSKRVKKYLKPGFHIIVSDARIVSVANFFVKRSGRLYGNTLAFASNDPCVRNDSIVPIEPCSILASETIGNDCLAIAIF